jgi:Carboxypeptidase regulatory-like domain
MGAIQSRGDRVVILKRAAWKEARAALADKYRFKQTQEEIATTWRFTVLTIALALSTAPLCAQTSSASTADLQFQDSPRATQSQASRTPAGEQGVGAISGTVLGTSNDVIQGARVVLTDQSSGKQREMQSGPNGEFMFSGLGSGTYQVIVTGGGMKTWASPRLDLHSGESRIVSQIVLPIASASTSVTVTADKETLSEQQVQIAVEQRIWKVFPNFYSSYDWNAPPMMPKQKFHLALRSMIDPMTFAGVAGVAGAQQMYNVFPDFGGGIEGYAKRYGAAYVNDFSARMLTSAVYASIFHQDPRYFYKGTGSIPSRTMYAVSRVVITRDDSGRSRPNYSRLLGVFTASALSNLYYPSDKSVLFLTLTNGAIELASHAGTNVVREFLLKGITAHAGGN